MNRLNNRWIYYTGILSLFSIGLIILFALQYWAIDQLGWGTIETDKGIRETSFLKLLYFSMGTFFRIGYGDQIPTGWNYLIVGLEALSSYILGLLFLAQVMISATERILLRQFRTDLEQTSFTSHRFR
jgi:hypothetical protein